MNVLDIVLKCIDMNATWRIYSTLNWDGNGNSGSIEFEFNWTGLKWIWLSVWIDISFKCCLGSAPEEFDFMKFSDVSANSFVFDWSTSFWIDFLMTSERLLFETPLSRNRRFWYLNRLNSLIKNVKSDTPIALARVFDFS